MSEAAKRAAERIDDQPFGCNRRESCIPGDLCKICLATVIDAEFRVQADEVARKIVTYFGNCMHGEYDASGQVVCESCEEIIARYIREAFGDRIGRTVSYAEEHYDDLLKKLADKPTTNTGAKDGD